MIPDLRSLTLGEYPETPQQHAPLWQPRVLRPPSDLVLGKDILDHWPNPPPLREDRLAGDEVNLAASASRQQVTSLAIESGAAAVWWWWAQSIGTAGDLVNVTWTLEVNGAPVAGFSGLRSRDAFGTLSIPQWIGLVVPQGSRLRVVATNETSSQILNVGAYIRAYWSRGRQ